jgi:hypothetical protein
MPVQATDRLRRSLRRPGFDLVDAERRGRFQIRREGSKVDETVGLDLAGVERWIRERAKDRSCLRVLHSSPSRLPLELQRYYPADVDASARVFAGRSLSADRAIAAVFIV